MKTYNVNIKLEEFRTLVVTIDLGNDIEQYKSSWLALCNHKREMQEILQVRNMNGNNLVIVVLDIDGSQVHESIKDNALKFATQFGKVVDYREEIALIQELDKLYTNEHGNMPIYIQC